MASAGSPVDLPRLQRAHRAFTVALGGYALEFAGGVFVTHERLPVGAFNYVDEVQVAPDRRSAFFERALDHYFQRALRPTFRVGPTVPDHVDRTLRRFDFRPRAEPLVYLVADRGEDAPTPRSDVDVREVGSEAAGDVAAFWTHEGERDEFRRSLEVAVHHPNPGERLVPLLASQGGSPVAAALAFTRDGVTEVHAVATQPRDRGQGIATALVARAAHGPASDGARVVAILASTPRLGVRLAPLGFREVARVTEYELPAGADLRLPPPGPPGPPRWRPPVGRASEG